MGELDNDSGFNRYGFKDVKFPRGIDKIGNKNVKVSVYCPAANTNSKSESKDLFPKLNISERIGDNWQNANFDLSDLEVLEQRIPLYKKALLEAGGAFNETAGIQT